LSKTMLWRFQRQAAHPARPIPQRNRWRLLYNVGIVNLIQIRKKRGAILQRTPLFLIEDCV
jgi:hypothetical protein